MNNEHAWLIIP